MLMMLHGRDDDPRPFWRKWAVAYLKYFWLHILCALTLAIFFCIYPWRAAALLGLAMCIALVLLAFLPVYRGCWLRITHYSRTARRLERSVRSAWLFVRSRF